MAENYLWDGVGPVVVTYRQGGAAFFHADGTREDRDIRFCSGPAAMLGNEMVFFGTSYNDITGYAQDLTTGDSYDFVNEDIVNDGYPVHVKTNAAGDILCVMSDGMQVVYSAAAGTLTECRPGGDGDTYARCWTLSPEGQSRNWRGVVPTAVACFEVGDCVVAVTRGGEAVVLDQASGVERSRTALDLPEAAVPVGVSSTTHDLKLVSADGRRVFTTHVCVE